MIIFINVWVCTACMLDFEYFLKVILDFFLILTLNDIKNDETFVISSNFYHEFL